MVLERIGRAMLFVGLALIVAPSPAWAFVQETTDSGAGLHWEKSTVHYRVNEKGSDDVPPEEAFAAVRRSFDTWQAEPCLPIVFVDDGPTSTRRVGYDEAAGPGRDALVIWQETANEWTHGRRVLALTTVIFEQSTGVIVDADVELNGLDFTFAVIDDDTEAPGDSSRGGDTDIENTVTHELGHLLGLGHPTDPQATMYARAIAGETSKRSLGDDDIDGLCTIYGDGLPNSGGGGGCQTGAGTATGGLLLLAAAALLTRRRWALLLAFSVILVPSLARAYVFFETGSGAATRWFEEEIPYTLDATGCEDLDEDAWRPALDRSFATWAELPCAPFHFASQGLADDVFHDVEADGVNAIVWVKRFWAHSRTAVALTTLLYRERTGAIVDADLEFNDESFTFTTTDEPERARYDVQNVATHEIGHILGLDHSENADATMAPRSREGDLELRTLTQDDIDGLCALYATAAPAPDVEVEQPDTVSPSASPDATTADAAVIPLPDTPGGGCAIGGPHPAPPIAIALLAMALVRRLKSSRSRRRAAAPMET